jgi:hypothetical protein
MEVMASGHIAVQMSQDIVDVRQNLQRGTDLMAEPIIRILGYYLGPLNGLPSPAVFMGQVCCISDGSRVSVDCAVAIAIKTNAFQATVRVRPVGEFFICREFHSYLHPN